MNIAHLDQVDAACRQVKAYVGRLQVDPPPGSIILAADSLDVHKAMFDRLQTSVEQQSVYSCCDRVTSPRPLYWVPRCNVVICEYHWAQVEVCRCFDHCDGCELPTDEAMFVYLFMGPYIVQAMLCLSCQSRVWLSPTGG